jgi:DNA-binding NarL/FixJ family response regulator
MNSTGGDPRTDPAAPKTECMAYDLVLVDDHKLMRDGIRTILERCGEFRVVAEAETGPEAVQVCRRLRPPLVLMDIGLPGISGIDATIEILRYCPDTRIVMLSMYDDENSVVGAIRSGARGFVLKKASSSDLLDALRIVARGGSYLSSQVSDRLLHRIQRGDLDARVQNPLDSLSPREVQVLRMVAEGKTSKDIAVLLDLGLQTVRSYRKTMMKKLGVNNVAGLTHVALAAGITRFHRRDANTLE